MPTYTYRCARCGFAETRFRAVIDRDEPAVCRCGGEARRIFDKPAAIVVPAHFALPADWAMPDKADAPAWENLGESGRNNSSVHEKRPERFKSYFDRKSGLK
jgi:putative FmdB family regulatory protein